MNRFALLGLWIATPLVAQETEEETRARVLAILTEDPAERDRKCWNQWSQYHLRNLPTQRYSQVVALPDTGELVHVRFENAKISLYAVDAKRSVEKEVIGEALAMWSGPFSARAFGDRDILVAMQTGNAHPVITLWWFHRRGGNRRFVAVGSCQIHSLQFPAKGPSGKEEKRTMMPSCADVLAWDAGSRTATLAFRNQTRDDQVGDIVIADVQPTGLPGFGGRLIGVHTQSTRIGFGAECRAIERNGELLVFVREADGHRAAPVRTFVRDSEKNWRRLALQEDIRVEPEFTLWVDFRDRIQLTTPISRSLGDNWRALMNSKDSKQSFRTYRAPKDLESGKWVEVPLDARWDGRILLGPELVVRDPQSKAPHLVWRHRDSKLLSRPLDG